MRQRAQSALWFFFRPTGRISRQPYALGILFWLALQAATIGRMYSGGEDDPVAPLVFSFAVALVAGVIGVVSILMLTIKRVHDIGHRDFLAFLIFVPVISFFALAFFLFFPSGPPNRYGYHTNAAQ